MAIDPLGHPSAPHDLDSDLLPTTTYMEGSQPDTDLEVDCPSVIPVPRQISRFEIRRRLGEGGFGSVFLAYDPMLDREVALKLPCQRPVWTVEQELNFLNEARTAARLQHPHVAAIYDVGTDPQGVFIAMEYVGGESLADRLRRGKLPLADAVRICGQIAEAMHQGHKLGLVHRDLKPSNIMLDRDGNVKVCDFGLAVHEDQQHYKRGDSSGTLSYMSPEQVRGESHLLDGRSDIWSLGVILYECLSGRRPFRGSSNQELREQILTRDPKPLRQLDDSIPAALDEFCRKCLKRSPAERLPTALDFQQGLAERRVPRGRSWVAALAVAAALIVGAAGVVAAVAWSGSPGKEAAQPAQGNLLTNRPQEVFFSPNFGQNTWTPRDGFLSIDSQHWSLIALDDFAVEPGKPQQLDVSASAFGNPALAGVFWGLHPAFDQSGSPVERCLLLVVEPGSEGGKSAMIRLYHFDIGKDQNLNASTPSTHHYGGVPLDVDYSKPIRLQLNITNGELASVRVQGEDVPWPPNSLPAWKEFAGGRFGVVAWKNKITYTSALLNSP